jgi:Uma2 family endonuclease
MTSAVRQLQPVSIAEFDDYVDRQADDAPMCELLDGVIVMMTTPTRRHGKIAGNIGWRLKAAMDKRGCESFQGDVSVQRDADRKAIDKLRPDIVVRCGPSDNESDSLNYVDDPVVVVEVLSPSTMDYDRGPKLIFYKSLPTLQHIVIAYQDEMRIEHYVRRGDEWAKMALTKPGDVLDLSAVAFTTTVTEAYFDVSIA